MIFGWCLMLNIDANIFKQFIHRFEYVIKVASYRARIPCKLWFTVQKTIYIYIIIGIIRFMLCLCAWISANCTFFKQDYTISIKIKFIHFTWLQFSQHYTASFSFFLTFNLFNFHITGKMRQKPYIVLYWYGVSYQ